MKTMGSGVVVVLPPDASKLDEALEEMIRIPRIKVIKGVEVSLANTSYSMEILRRAIASIAKCFRHSAFVELNFTNANMHFATLVDGLLLDAFRSIRLNLSGIKLTLLDVEALVRLAPVLDGLIVRNTVLVKDVLHAFVEAIGHLPKLQVLDLSKLFFARRYPMLFHRFLVHLCPTPWTCRWPNLKALYLDSNYLPKDDAIALLSALYYNQSIKHLSIAHSLPTIDQELGAWLALTVLNNPSKWSSIESLNLAGATIQPNALSVLAHADITLGSLVSHLDSSQGYLAPGFYTITDGLLYASSDQTMPLQSHLSFKFGDVVQVLASSATQAALLIPGYGVGYVDISSISVEKSVDSIKIPPSVLCTHLVLDDLKPTGILIQLVNLVAEPGRLLSLRLRRYPITPAEVGQLITICHSLRALDMKACRLNEISMILPAFERLSSLNLNKNLIGAAGATHIARHLPTSSLVELHIGRNMMGEIGLDALDHALENNKTLERLIIDTMVERDVREAFILRHHHTPLYAKLIDTDAKWSFIGVLTGLHRQSAIENEITKYSQLLDPTLLKIIFHFAGEVIYRSVVEDTSKQKMSPPYMC